MLMQAKSSFTEWRNYQNSPMAKETSIREIKERISMLQSYDTITFDDSMQFDEIMDEVERIVWSDLTKVENKIKSMGMANIDCVVKPGMDSWGGFVLLNGEKVFCVHGVVMEQAGQCYLTNEVFF